MQQQILGTIGPNVYKHDTRARAKFLVHQKNRYCTLMESLVISLLSLIQIKKWTDLDPDLHSQHG